MAERVHAAGLVVLISDLFDNPGDVLNALHHFRYRKHEVLLLHVMAKEELTFPFDSWSEFQDLEAAARTSSLDPQSVRAAYLDEVHQFLRQIEHGCGQMDVDYVQMSTDQPFDLALAHYLAHRRSRK